MGGIKMELLAILVTSILAGLITYYLNHFMNKGPVFASAIVVITAGLILPKIFVNGYTLALVATCASYAGMSAKIRMTNLWEMGISCILLGLIFVGSSEALVGYGGRLGTIAAISVITVWGAKSLYEHLKVPLAEKQKLKTKNS